MNLLLRQPKTAIAARIFDESLVQGFGREVGPIGGREIEFAVGALEGQVVADTLLAAGADDEVRVRLPRGIQA